MQDFRITNGRKLGKIFGKFSSMQWNGGAVVDYIITQASNLKTGLLNLRWENFCHGSRITALFSTNLKLT